MQDFNPKPTGSVSPAAIPVFAQSQAAIAKLAQGVTLSAQSICQVAAGDPGLALHLVHAANAPADEAAAPDAKRQLRADSVARAVLVLGVERTLRVVKGLPAVARASESGAGGGLLKTLAVAHHARELACGWTRTDHKPEAEAIGFATLAQFLGELALWASGGEYPVHLGRQPGAENLARVSHHPTATGADPLAVAGRTPSSRLDVASTTPSPPCGPCPPPQRRLDALASRGGEKCGLDRAVRELSQKLAVQWCMPKLAVDCHAPASAMDPHCATVLLATRLARAAACDWQSEESLRCLDWTAQTLDETADKAVARVHRQTVEAARRFARPFALLAARALPLPPGEGFPAPVLSYGGPTKTGPGSRAAAVPPARTSHHPTAAAADPLTVAGRTPSSRLDVVSTTPSPLPNPCDPDRLVECVSKLRSMGSGAGSLQASLQALVDAMHDALHIDRAAFAMVTRDRQELVVRFTSTGADASLKSLRITLDAPHLFKRLLERQQAVWLNDTSRPQLWPLVPTPVRKLIVDQDFCAMSLFVKTKPVGLLYADWNREAPGLDARDYQSFKQLCAETGRALARLAS